MNRVIPHYQVLETKEDFPNWKIKILSGNYKDLTVKIDKLGIPQDVEDDSTPIRIELDYTIEEGNLEEPDERLMLTQTIGWIIEDIVA